MQHPGRESRHRRVGVEVMFRALARYDKKGGLRLVRLWRGWPEVVGPEVAELARPLGHKEATLLLWAQDAVAAQQLSYYVPELLARVNEFLGQEVFDKVRFELLDSRVPLGGSRSEAPRAPLGPPPRPPRLGALVDRLDPESAVGRCYRAYVRRFAAEAARGQEEPAQDRREAGAEENTRPLGAHRRRK
jgi:hypothetical protein